MRLTFNGSPREHDPAPDDTAAEVIRTAFGATGTKVSCGAGVCGACTILVDGEPKVSCLLPAAHLDGGRRSPPSRGSVVTIPCSGPSSSATRSSAGSARPAS